MGTDLPATATPKRPSRLALLALIPLTLFVLALDAFLSGSLPLELRFAWIPSFGIDLAFRLDALSLQLVLLIAGIGTLVFIYAGGYMAGTPRRERLFILLLVFMVAMLGAVTADDLVVLFLFWEMTSITSFMLVGFKHEYESSRKSAQQALMVTATGGLVLLAGVILLSQVAGTTSIQGLLATSETWIDHPLVPSALVCLFIGAFTKSAQFPFHFWLSNAMAAPTPVSAYLHSATMVKLGVYLLARLHPAFGDLPIWQLTLVSVGGFTSVWAMILTVRERDLKRILAWSTVSALGTLVMMIGLPGEGAATAAAAFLLAHALYKAPLFFVAGNIDLATGTRVIDDLCALGRRLPMTAIAGLLAGISMAGLPLSFGFVAKDVIKAAQGGIELFTWVAYAGVFVSALSVAAAAVATVRIFYWRGRTPNPPDVREGQPATWLPPLALAIFGIVLGLYPGLVEGLLFASASTMGPALSFEALREGNGSGLVALAFVVGLGVLLFILWDKLHRVQKGFSEYNRYLQVARWYDWSMAALPGFASAVTRRLQRGRLTVYVAMMLVFTLGLLVATLAESDAYSLPDFDLEAFIASKNQLVVGAAALALLAASIGVSLAKSPFVMLLISGLVGLASALLFLFLGAPDVAFTQFLVEVAFVVVLVAILLRVRQLDLVKPPTPSKASITARALTAILAGGLVGALILITHVAPVDPALNDYFAAQSVPAAHGRNVVNVILVDFRATDTLGEVLVVAFTLLASLPLLKLLEAKRQRRRDPGPRGMTEHAHILDIAVRPLYPIMLLGALYILVRGHNEPGGGFIGGMVAVAATSMLAVARGSAHAIARMPLGPVRLAGLSGLLALCSGLPALALGKPYMTHLWFDLPLGFTELPLSTVLVFDLGVFGVVWAALGGLTARAVGLDEVEARPSLAEARPLGARAVGLDEARTDGKAEARPPEVTP